MILTLLFLEDNFCKFNKQYFNDELPMPNFIMTSTRQMLGQCGSENWKAKRPTFIIKVSNYYDRTEHEYLNTLLHEMIHLYFQFHGDWNEGHGKKFQTMARSFDKYGWNIQTKEHTERNPNVIVTRTIMTFREIANNKIWVCCISQDRQKMLSFKNYINVNSYYDNPKFYHCDNCKVFGMMVHHKRLGGYTMTEQQFQEEYLPILKEFDF